MNDLPGGFFLYKADEEERILYANSETIHILGCSTLDEFLHHVNHSFRGLVYPDDLNKVESDIVQQIRNSPRNLDSVEYRIIRKDGQIRWLFDYGHLIHSKRWGDVLVQ